MDIFFVLSGYLIARIILSEIKETGRLNFFSFYERRARRILPALIFVILSSFPLAYTILWPTALVDFAKSILATQVFVSNFYFYLTTTEYGADSALLEPLLHTWSLGIEEQFYILFPLIALWGLRQHRFKLLHILIILCGFSLLYANFLGFLDRDQNFYLITSRFWELAAGAILAAHELASHGRKPKRLRQFGPVVGLTLILMSLLAFGSSTPHPSILTAVPVGGVMLVIAFASQDEPVGRFLSNRALV